MSWLAACYHSSYFGSYGIDTEIIYAKAQPVSSVGKEDGDALKSTYLQIFLCS